MTETVSRLTPAQIRALEWLPENGEWRGHPGRRAATLNRLALGKLYEGWIFGPERGWGLYWRLTPAGIEARTRRAGERAK